MTGIERQQKFVTLAASHADDFKTRVSRHDRENSFPFENIEALKTSGYLNMTAADRGRRRGRQFAGLRIGAGAAGAG